jgi:hypothetical protein
MAAALDVNVGVALFSPSMWRRVRLGQRDGSLRVSVLRLMVMLAAANMSAACVPLGGKTVHVNIETDPAGAEVFLIPLITWDAYGGEAFLKRPDLQGFRIGGNQVTPFDFGVSYAEQVLVVRIGDRVAWKQVTPDEGKTLSLRFQRPDP